MEPLLLSADELAGLTGYRLAKHQRRWLKERGWVFEVNANGRPIVARSYAKNRLGCPSDTPQTPSTIRPNFAALKAI